MDKKYILAIAGLLIVGVLYFHFGNKNSDDTSIPPEDVLVTWRQPQACPQYGGAKQCYVAEGAFGGYDNWAATKATFIWSTNPCPNQKKVVAIKQAGCVYETTGTTGMASSTIKDGNAIIDCRRFATQWKDDACTCNNGITLNAKLQCE